MPILEPHDFELHTLTPLWTGGPKQSCGSRIFETGILGSLRWWLEACARTRVAIPDPVAENLQYDPKHPQRLDQVSRIFGATGWRRRFRLSIVSPTLVPIPEEVKVATGPHPNPRNRRESTNDSLYYYRGGKAWAGPFVIRIQACAPWDPKYDGLSVELFRDLLALIAQYGALGAKPQMGLGIVRLVKPAPVPEFPALRQWLESLTGRPAAGDPLPSLSDMFFGEMPAAAQGTASLAHYWRDTTFTQKSGIRRKFSNPALRHEVCGEIPARSKILISHPYLNEEGSPRQRYCAWLPGNLGTRPNGGLTVRDTIVRFFPSDTLTDGAKILGGRA